MGEHGDDDERDDEEAAASPSDDSQPDREEAYRRHGRIDPDSGEQEPGDERVGAAADGDEGSDEDDDQHAADAASDETPDDSPADTDEDDDGANDGDGRSEDGDEGRDDDDEHPSENGDEGPSDEDRQAVNAMAYDWEPPEEPAGDDEDDREENEFQGDTWVESDDLRYDHDTTVGPEHVQRGPNGDETDEPTVSDERRAVGSAADDDDGGATGDGEAASADSSGSTTEDEIRASTGEAAGHPGENLPEGIGSPAPAGGGGGGGGGGGSTSSLPGFSDDMAPDDEELPLTAHIEEMTQRFLVVALVMGLVAAVALLWSDDMINFLWYAFLGPDDGTCPGPACPLEWRPHIYHPLSLVLARLKMAALVGFVAGLPVAVYQVYRFMRPGLYPHERRYYLAAVPTSLVLAVAGLAFAFYIVLPSLFIYFSAYTTQAAELAFALSDTFNLMVMMLGFFALIFQIPLLVMLAIMMGVTTRRWLEERRIYFWTGFGGVAFVFSPDPTGMAPLLVAVTMIALFEGTLLLLRWTERSVALFSAETMEANRPYAWALAALVGYVVSTGPIPASYFDQLPPVVVETLTEWGYVGLTPAIIAAAIIGVFELLGFLARRIGAGQGVRTGLRVRLAFIRLRAPVWLLALVVGYMGSPDPILLEIFRDVNLAPPLAVGVVFVLIAAYEGLRLLLSYVRPQ